MEKANLTTLQKRVLTSLIMVPVVIGAMRSGHPLIDILVYFVGIMLSWEWSAMMPNKRANVYAVCYAFALGCSLIVFNRIILFLLIAAVTAFVYFKAKDDKDGFIFRNKKQWWAVYRVLSTFCNYPKQMTAFGTKMKELKVDEVDGKRDYSYDSLSAAPKEVPQMATCSPSAWNAFKDINENYKQQYDVAEFLMQKLGIKS